MKAVSLLGVLAFATACTGHETMPVNNNDVVKGRELYCICMSREEALKIAEEYSIELVSWSNNTAVFHTEDDPSEVIRYGKEKGLTELSLNRIIKRKD